MISSGRFIRLGVLHAQFRAIHCFIVRSFKSALSIGGRGEFHKSKMFVFVDVDRRYLAVFTEQTRQIRFAVLA